ncbi:MAG: hypothetical protein R2751_04490 [Bacteroidales bacterium]
MRGIRFVSFLGMWLSCAGLAGQDPIHKASRQEVQTFSRDMEGVLVQGEKAVVTVKGWDRDQVQVTLRPVARNQEAARAAADLRFVQYAVGREANTLVIRNSFRGEGLDKITSNLSMEIEILLPETLPVSVTNLYGPVNATGLGDLELSVSFASAALTDISGTCAVKARYATIDIAGVGERLEVDAEKSDIRARDLPRQTRIRCSYGSAWLDAGRRSQDIAVEASRTPVDLRIGANRRYDYDLTALHGTIYLPSGPVAGKETLVQHFPGSEGVLRCPPPIATYTSKTLNDMKWIQRIGTHIARHRIPGVRFLVVVLLVLSGRPVNGQAFRGGEFDKRLFALSAGPVFSGEGDCIGFGNKLSHLKTVGKRVYLSQELSSWIVNGASWIDGAFENQTGIDLSLELGLSPFKLGKRMVSVHGGVCAATLVISSPDSGGTWSVTNLETGETSYMQAYSQGFGRTLDVGVTFGLDYRRQISEALYVCARADFRSHVRDGSAISMITVGLGWDAKKLLSAK